MPHNKGGKLEWILPGSSTNLTSYLYKMNIYIRTLNSMIIFIFHRNIDSLYSCNYPEFFYMSSFVTIKILHHKVEKANTSHLKYIREK